MRIALFIDTDRFAGTESHILELARGLQNKGVKVKVVCPAASPLADKAFADGLDVILIKKHGLMDWSAIRKLCHLLKTGEVDIIHAHNGRTAFLSAIAVMLAKKGRCIATQHFLEPAHISLKGPMALLYRTVHRWVNQKTDYFITISNAAQQEMLERCDAQADKISVIPNGITMPDLSILTSPNNICKEFNIGVDVSLIVCVGRLELEKDIASLIAAMSNVVVKHPKVVCIIAGEGSKKEELRKQIEQAKLKEVVRLVGFRADAISLIYSSDIFVLPSLAESFGLVILEAMALGKPVVATRVGGPSEIVVDGETGLLAPPFNPEALAEAMLDLLKDPQKRERMGRKGQERFLEKYTAGRMAEATLDVYKQLLSIK